jgi:hypothetical protein
LTVPATFEQLVGGAYAAGARVYSNSWGNVLPNGMTPGQFAAYDAYTQGVDHYIAEHDDFLVIFAASNDGQTSQLANVPPPAIGKNLLSVGAVSDGLASWQAQSTIWAAAPQWAAFFFNATEAYWGSDAVAFFSSVGPTGDGRFKPDVCAPGHSIRSANADGLPASFNDGTDYKSGTSMAAPAVVRDPTFHHNHRHSCQESYRPLWGL